MITKVEYNQILSLFLSIYRLYIVLKGQPVVSGELIQTQNCYIFV